MNKHEWLIKRDNQGKKTKKTIKKMKIANKDRFILMVGYRETIIESEENNTKNRLLLLYKTPFPLPF